VVVVAVVVVTDVLVWPGVQITQTDCYDIDCASVGCNKQQQKPHGTVLYCINVESVLRHFIYLH
jgi:hypothetical protein